jgi:protein TonB
MRQAFLVSVGLHLLVALLLIVPVILLGRRVALSPRYDVRLVELPAPPPAVLPAPAPPPPAITPSPPKPLAKPKSSRPPPRRETVKPTPAPQETPPPARPAPPAAGPPSSAPSAVPSAVLPKIDTPGFDCTDYCAAFLRKIETQWVPPPVTQDAARAVVAFTIRQNGAVDSVVLEVSSGNFYFDQAAQRAILLAAPLPPLPRTFLDPSLRVHLTFSPQPAPPLSP